ncbi:unnamed protein product [Hermetia illucens]|uniref:SRCR domain-containing protein n=1 Tax=Hermetia illucens TaxID=343691 RepID=A0A7R8UET9_HERIL|nr:unnamed protein product [Hermetia illucens]
MLQQCAKRRKRHGFASLIRRVLLYGAFTATVCLVLNIQSVLAQNEIKLNEIDPGDPNVHYDANSNPNANKPMTELAGGSIVGERILRADESPFIVRTDIEIENGAKLVIESGVTMYFAPMVGITVRGTIKAVGTPDRKITLTSQQNTGYGDNILPEPEEVAARLVDGPSPLQGRLQIYYKGSWRSVCTNSRNWTVQDYETACRQMGYQGGRFWNWVERNWNFQPRLLYEEPNCRGTESSLLECSWHTKQIGSGVCDYHSDIGIQCLPIHESPLSHWRGLQFDNAPTTRTLSEDNTVYSSVSESLLRYVNIVRAGSGRGRTTVGSIEVIGIPPVLEFVTVDHSAYTGINVTLPDSGFVFRNVTVRRSKGFGVFVNSSCGLAHLEDCIVSENGADGVRYVGHDLRTEDRKDRTTIYDFCTVPNTAGQTYPISVSLKQSKYDAGTKECMKAFQTKRGYVLTASFVYFTIAQNETAQIDVYDGTSVNDRLLKSWMIRNSTRVQSISSTKEKIFIRFKANPRAEMLGFLRLTTGPFKTYDLNVTRSVIADNGGRGVAVDNLRSMVHLHRSVVSSNGHVAGLHVTSGAGDVNVTQTKISFNQGDGVNITYYGGNRNISRSSLSSNGGYGLSLWLNETSDKERMEFVPVNQTTVVEYSEIVRNLETGIRHGNFCGDFWVNITGNWFNDSKSNDVDIQTCWFDRVPDGRLRLQIGHNLFEHSNRVGVLISPALNLLGKIEYNHFRFGKHGAIYIKNKEWEEFRMLPVQLNIQHNQLYKNQGYYVVSLGLSPYGDRETQHILFTRNFVKDNKVVEPFGSREEGTEGAQGEGRLNPRSRVSAAVVISSSNVDVFRNIISNKDSRYEVGSQLSDQSRILNVTYNWLGHGSEEVIYQRVFHRKDRYDLAKIEYMPFLLHNSNPGTNTVFSQRIFVPKFYSEGSEYIGGEVDGQEVIPPGIYTVNRDVNIRPGGKLILSPGATLNFEPSVGMMVAGKLEARGRRPDDILFTLKQEIVVAANETNEALNDEMAVIDIETDSVIGVNETPKVPIRLLGGVSEHEGRLQVYLNGKWGTVCDYGWNIINAALVCNQLGLALNPSDWRLLRSEVPGSGTTEEILLSNVRCTEHDTDITKCRAERFLKGEFENSCTHEHDVGLRCYEGAWAGLRFGVLAERADLQYVTIEKAGLFDYTTNSFKPAMQMDFAKHNLENVRVVNNLHDGLGVVYSDVFGGISINNVKNSEFMNNRGSGVSLKQLGLRMQGSTIKNNLGSGIAYNPVLSAVEQRELASWFYMPPDFNVFDSDFNPFRLPEDNYRIDLDPFRMKHIITNKHYGDPIDRKVYIRCEPGYVIGIQLLNPIENRSTEEIWIHDAQAENSRADTWSVKRDLSVFPATSTSYGVILNYKSGEKALGGAVLILSVTPAPVQNIKNRIVKGPVPTLYVKSTKIQNNSRGVSAMYYNRYLGERGEHYLRKANESYRFVNTEISNNRGEAFLVRAPFWDVHVSNLSEVSIHINGSLILKNGRGIHHISKDLRSSNNLFHYVLQDTTIEENSDGGLQVSLPYVWQYNENFTHSVYLGNDTWIRNNNFEVKISGHYAIVNITSNVFRNNNCKRGLIAMHGMEKKMKIDNNQIDGNNGRYIFDFRADSLSEILGEVPAILQLNDIRNNRYELPSTFRSAMMRENVRKAKTYLKNPTCVIGFGGIQKVTIYRNLIANNKMDYDLVAGIKSARVNNYLYARENWWGSIEDDYIISRIFDFDDWNNHAEVVFRPYLLENSFDASVSVAFERNPDVDLDNLGGRIFRDTTIYRRDKPYWVRSDITVMPGITLTIDNGVVMEFAPNVGILVLGTLKARGFKDGHIIMRPKFGQSQALTRIERSLENLVAYDSIRLCTKKNCSSSENEVDTTHEGFLEYFNHTTLQWVPICDRRFTERNAQVVCRELGFDPLDVYFAHDRRIEFHTNSLTRIWSWVEPMECRGDESRLELCPERLNGQLYGRRHECHWDDEFVFVSCNGDFEPKNYWGGVRFANPDFENNIYQHRLHDHRTHGVGADDESHMEFVRIEGAGILHNEKSPAIQTIFKSPIISSVTIKNSAHHGVNLISPSKTMHLKFLNIENTLGHGINVLSLTGEGRESDESSFAPLKAIQLPYNLFSLIDICDTTKVITVEERIILYYKYDNNPVNCVKIFNTPHRIKPLGFRLLQSNLFNHSKEYGRTDSINLYDGDIYNISSIFLGKVETDSDNEKNLFRTKSPTLSVRLIASGAPATHGFIAEVITLPISVLGYSRDAQHNVSYSEISGTVAGALSYSTAGEVSPILTLEGNRFTNNCRQMYGNFSTCEAAIEIDVQNMQSVHFRNNLVQQNQGGLFIRADSRGSATSLRGWIHHNLFAKNRNRPALYVEGRQSSPYQEVIVYNNYFSQNDAKYENVIKLRQVLSNFTYNYVHSNYGGRILEISGFDKVRLPIYQTTSHNGFYDNVATDWRGRATIVAGTAGQHYVDNIFRNPNNDYEIITVNRSIFDFQYWNNTIDVWKTKIDATHNYWSYNETISVGSRIRDKSDDPLLLEVQFIPFHMNNETILDGKCPPGWNLVLDTCFMYVGAPMTFYEAREFCRSDNASMPFIRTDSETLWAFLQHSMRHLRYPEKVWVQDFNYIDKCTSFIYRTTDVEDCNNRMPFICEIDPKVVIDPLSLRADVFAISIISAFILVIILLVLIGVCWYMKSRHRHVQRLERRHSIRQSLRSLNSIDPQGSMRRRNFNMSASTNTLTKSSVTDYKKMTSNGSIDSMDKSVLSSETSYDAYDPKAAHYNEYSNQPNGNGYHNNALAQKYNEYANQSKAKSSPVVPVKTATVGSTRSGFRDNSTFSGTRNNSVSTTLTEDTPIIHQTDTEDVESDYYGNSSTLPLRSKGENLAFLSELKHRLPEYESPKREEVFQPAHSSFLPPPPDPPGSEQSTASSTLPYDKKIDRLQFSPTEDDQFEEIRRPAPVPAEVRRPDSYYTAVRSSRAPKNNNLPPPPSPIREGGSGRPRTVYEAAEDPRPSYSRSKSEALLETNFDEAMPNAGLQADNRSYSQPLETAM